MRHGVLRAPSSSTPSAVDRAASLSHSQSDVLVLPSANLLRGRHPDESVPLHLSLHYALCLPCRAAGSRCEGHDNYTQSCLQCEKRGVECQWQLAKGSLKRGRSRSTRSRSRASTAGLTTEDEQDEEEENLSDEDDYERSRRAESIALMRRKRRRAKSTDGEYTTADDEDWKEPVPSAGWPSKGGSVSVIRGKGKLVKAEVGTDEEVEGHEKDAVTEDGDSESGSSTSGDDAAMSASQGLASSPAPEEAEDKAVQQLLDSMSTTARGSHFLHQLNYASLLTSLAHSEQTDLAAHLHWFSTSPLVQKLRVQNAARLPRSQAEAQLVSSVDIGKLENFEGWDKWPRPPERGRSAKAKGKARGMEQSSLPQALAGEATRLLSASDLEKRVLESLASPHHYAALVASHQKHGRPKSFLSSGTHTATQGSSTYRIPPISAEALADRYLNRETLILDHIESVQAPLVLDTTQRIDSVLLNVARMREPRGMRRHKAPGRATTTPAPSEGRSQEPIWAEEGSIAEGIRLPPMPTPSGSTTPAQRRATPQQTNGSGEPDLSSLYVPVKVKKVRQPQAPIDWNSLLSSVTCLPGQIIPREVLERTLARCESLYGPHGSDGTPLFSPSHASALMLICPASLVLKHFDAMHPSLSTLHSEKPAPAFLKLATTSETGQRQTSTMLGSHVPVPKVVKRRKGKDKPAETVEENNAL